MPNVFRSVQRAERRAAALPTGYRVNLGLYAMALLGVGLIVLEVRGAQPVSRQVQSLPRMTTGTTRPAVTPTTGVPTVLGPGDLTPTPPPEVTPGGVVTGAGPVGPSAPNPISAQSGEVSDPSPATTTDLGLGLPMIGDLPSGTVVVFPPPPSLAGRAAPIDPRTPPVAGTVIAPVIPKPVEIAPVPVPPPVSVPLPRTGAGPP